MHDIGAAFGLALGLVLSGDPDLLEIIGLSLRVSLTAVLIAAALGLPLGALLAIVRFPGRSAVILTVNAPRWTSRFGHPARRRTFSRRPRSATT